MSATNIESIYLAIYYSTIHTDWLKQRLKTFFKIPNAKWQQRPIHIHLSLPFKYFNSRGDKSLKYNGLNNAESPNKSSKWFKFLQYRTHALCTSNNSHRKNRNLNSLDVTYVLFNFVIAYVWPSFNSSSILISSWLFFPPIPSPRSFDVVLLLMHVCLL